MTTSTTRVETRISLKAHAMLKRAAEIQGRTMSDFIASVIYEAARKTVEQAEIIRLSREGQVRFANAILSPPKLNKELKQAIKEYKEYKKRVAE